MPLVAAAALPHTPQLLVRPETEDRDMVLRVHAAYAEAKRGLAAVRPDVVCILGGDHIEGFFLTSVPALAVYVGSSVSGKFDRYRYTFAVHEPLARAILEQGVEQGFDLAYSQDLGSTTPSTCRSTSSCLRPLCPSCRSTSTCTCRRSRRPRAAMPGAGRSAPSWTRGRSAWPCWRREACRTSQAATATTLPTTTGTARCSTRSPPDGAGRPPPSPARSSTRRATSSSGPGSRSWAPSATLARK